MAELIKPCPFCDGKGYVICGSSFKFGFPSYTVECEKCGTVGIIKASEQEAIEAWNTRAKRTTRLIWNKHNDCLECENCGKGMKPEWAYCPRCGAEVVRR